MRWIISIYSKNKNTYKKENIDYKWNFFQFFLSYSPFLPVAKVCTKIWENIYKHIIIKCMSQYILVFFIKWIILVWAKYMKTCNNKNILYKWIQTFFIFFFHTATSVSVVKECKNICRKYLQTHYNKIYVLIHTSIFIKWIISVWTKYKQKNWIKKIYNL